MTYVTSPHSGDTPGDFGRDLLSNLYYQRGTTLESASAQDTYHSLALTVRNRLVDRYIRTAAAHYRANPRFIYYLSAEYMLGKQLDQNLLYSGTEDSAHRALEGLGLSSSDLDALDVEPGLGNGGLGRLAACLLDAMASQDIPAVGYGIRYDFGIFKQAFQDGGQVERPDDWTFYGNPWEFHASDDQQTVGFYGHVEPLDGVRKSWVPGEVVLGEPSHMLVPGYGTSTVNIIRLWRARAARESFDLSRFGAGQYGEAVEEIVRSENISKVLYPDDSTELGRELRLKQQHFLVTCALRDIVRRFRLRNSDWDDFAGKVVIQLNDTHPVMAIAELMRMLVDEEGLEWDRAWSITRRVFAYTCHTLLPEALETWPVALVQRLLPRHMEIIFLINHLFLQEVAARYPGDDAKLRELSIIQEGGEQRVRMAHLAVVGSSAVNGVAELHSRLLAATTLRGFAELWPGRFHNVTNGVSPRRFVRLANPRLSGLISERLGGQAWLTDLDRLVELEPAADDSAFRERWREIKRLNREDLARHALAATGVAIDPDALCDVMIKRFHEYKRQLLRVLHVVAQYHRIRRDQVVDVVPRTIVFGGKAAPGYYAAKRIMRLANTVADLVNEDPVVSPYLKMVFLPDYNVSRAQLIIPAADLSEQISLAGKEASGTSNMKLALNGALTIGTLDGANVEIRDRVGADNFFLFGLDTTEVAAVRERGYDPRAYYDRDAELREVLDTVAHYDKDIVDDLLHRDEYLTLADYRAYVDCQDQVARAWRDREGWTRTSILNTARSGFFSSDRTVRDYCRDIWHVTPLRIDG
ncbi:glycogen/starch/alpha-glucan phosphorylase [Actinoplanes auranticolor]|uniref:Alpha-1,4 glucan phosphorylase n=1 Tax=Actinoplanes auranticolor TaxID=47988 RepID=A0A919S526_9ACTN|nr:glycogen/starch/alpha-glucan phosphorylase [Actinoplanes auranticolor]GIM64201.1 alpha-1,4 glucan phosphorylase [Actinoplanes auranticolor]